MDDGDDKRYQWEGEYKKTWEDLEDDKTLQKLIDSEVIKAKKLRLNKRSSNRRLGMIRHVCIVIDMSLAMCDHDMKPARSVVTLKLLLEFVSDFFDQNPISQLAFYQTLRHRAFTVSELSGDARAHKRALQHLYDEVMKTNGKCCLGEPSFQNSLELAQRNLSSTQSHTSREVIVIYASLTTCDRRPMQETLELMKKEKIKCNFIGLSAESYVCKKLSTETGGTFNVAMDEDHYRDLLYDFLHPPDGKGTESSLMRMGFPQYAATDKHTPLAYSMIAEVFTAGGYKCPQCKANYTTLPVDCHLSGLTLVAAPDLARSYHHLFALPQFNEVVETGASGDAKCLAAETCFSCLKLFAANDSKAKGLIRQCARCHNDFCLDCNIFFNEILHSCPGCMIARCDMIGSS